MAKLREGASGATIRRSALGTLADETEERRVSMSLGTLPLTAISRESVGYWRAPCCFQRRILSCWLTLPAPPYLYYSIYVLNLSRSPCLE